MMFVKGKGEVGEEERNKEKIRPSIYGERDNQAHRQIYVMVLHDESRYVQERVQFGVPIGNSQLVQEKMMRMAGNVQAMRLLAIRVSELLDNRTLSSGQAALAKAWNTLRGRECAALAREILGGNGILSQYHVAKVFGDMEAIFTYEGTYDINSLAAGRELLGYNAIRLDK